MLVAVGVEDDRPLAELLLQAVGVELRLLLADARVAARALGLDQPERLAVVAPQHVVDEALALVVRHAADLELAVARLVERPAGLLEQQVDEVVAGLGLGVVVRVRLRCCGLASALATSARRRCSSSSSAALSAAAPRASRRALAARASSALQLLERLLDDVSLAVAARRDRTPGRGAAGRRVA